MQCKSVDEVQCQVTTKHARKAYSTLILPIYYNTRQTKFLKCQWGKSWGKNVKEERSNRKLCHQQPGTYRFQGGDTANMLLETKQTLSLENYNSLLTITAPSWPKSSLLFLQKFFSNSIDAIIYYFSQLLKTIW